MFAYTVKNNEHHLIKINRESFFYIPAVGQLQPLRTFWAIPTDLFRWNSITEPQIKTSFEKRWTQTAGSKTKQHSKRCSVGALFCTLVPSYPESPKKILTATVPKSTLQKRLEPLANVEFWLEYFELFCRENMILKSMERKWTRNPKLFFEIERKKTDYSSLNE